MYTLSYDLNSVARIETGYFMKYWIAYVNFTHYSGLKGGISRFAYNILAV